MRTFCFILMLCCMMGGQAQRRRVKIKEPVFDTTPEEAMKVYDFDLAEEILNAKIEYLNAKGEPTAYEDSLLERVMKGQLKIQATERIQVIDSLILPKKQLLDKLDIGGENGSIHRATEYFNRKDTLECSVFLNQKGNRRIFSQRKENGSLKLFEQYLIGKTWTETQELQGLDATEEDNLNYPYMLSDGITLYYAAENEDGLGGYDIYLTRYDADSHSFLASENIGMPFNSPANDYMLCIDEFHNLGWFATDRNVSGDSVCLYTFIPNTSRKIYNEEEIGMDKLRELARISSIRDTWNDTQTVLNAKKTLAERANKAKTQKRKRDFTFVVNDHQTCYQIADFKSDNAKERAKNWMKSTKDLNTTKQQLDQLRAAYAKASNEERTKLAPQIRIMEKKVEQLTHEIAAEEIVIRKLELSK